MCALNGGKLIQHTNHGGGHPMMMFDGTMTKINSLHHQMCFPFNLPKDSYRILGWQPVEEYKSDFYIGENNEQIELPEDFVEPEMIIFNQNEMGVQYHPEFMPKESDGVKHTYRIFKQFMNNEL